MDPIDGWPGDDDSEHDDPGHDDSGHDAAFGGYDGDFGDGFDGDGDGFELVANDAGSGDPLTDGFDPVADFGGTDDSAATDDGGGGAPDDGPVEADESIGPAVAVEESIGPAVDPTDDPDGWNPFGDDPVEDIEMIGTDPDAPADEPVTDWTELFPPYLQLPDLPEPGDGWPWSDAGFLGADLAPGDPLYGLPVGADLRVDVADLLAYAGDGGGGYADDGWAALTASDDPATAALARFWSPGGGPA